MPPPRVQPEKKYGEMFQKWLKLEEKDIYSDLEMVLQGRFYRFKVKKNESFDFDRIQSLPDAVVLLVEGHPKKFEEQFASNINLKRMMIMHLFFGTQKIFFMRYFDHEDFKLRHECNQQPVEAVINAELKKMFDYLSKIFVACLLIFQRPSTKPRARGSS